MFNKKEYNKNYLKKYREEHREELNAKRREYYLKNKEHTKKINKEWYESHKEQKNEYCKKYRQEHGKRHIKDKEKLEYFKSIVSNHYWYEISDLYYKKFGIRLSRNEISDIKYTYKLKSDVKRGKIPEWFKSYLKEKKRDLFEERIHKGYVEIKVKQPSVWKFKHIYIWEQAYGKLPKGYVLLFKDGNKLNCSLDNLLLVSLKDLILMSIHIGIKTDSGEDIIKTGVLISKLMQKKNKIKKGEN